MLKILLRPVAAAALIVLPLAACGGGGSTSSSSGTSSADVTVHALDSLKFDKAAYTAKAGDLTIAYVNDGSLVHTLLIQEKADFSKLQVGGRGETKTGKVNLTAGTYTLFCDVPGHEAAGMKATLTVS
jgi:nitrite reductase (NO-forming)